MPLRRPLFVIIGSIAVIVGPALTGLQQTQAAVSAVTGVAVHGHGTIPATVDIGWVAPSDPAYAGARVVVVAGSSPTATPTDPTAVFTTDVAAPATSVAFGPGTGAQRYAVSVFAYTSGAAEFASPNTATWLTPAPVTGLSMSFTDASIGAGWANVAGNDYLACLAAGTVATPEPTSGPDCRAPTAFSATRAIAQFYPLVNGQTYTLSVFSKDHTTGEWSTPTSRTAVLDPPSDVRFARTAGVNDHALQVQWYTGDENRHIVVQMAEGLQPPADSATPIVDADYPVQSTAVRTVTGLKANTPYTFVVRNRLSGGYLTKPGATTTGIPHTPGAALATNNTPASSWGSTRPPKATKPQAVFAVAPNGTVYTLYGAGTGNLVRIYFSSRSPAGRWSAPVQLGTSINRGDTDVNAKTSALFLDRSPSGQLVAAFFRGDIATTGAWVYRVRSAGSAVWGAAHTLSQMLMGLAQDRRGRLHLLTFAGGLDRHVYYRTNSGGRWSVQAISARPNFMTTANALAYDPVTNRVVIAVGTWKSRSFLGVVVGSTPATATRFARTTISWTGSLWPNSVTANNGQIAIGLYPSGRNGGPWLLRGTSPTTMRGAVTVWRTKPTDGPPIVTSTKGGINVSWARFNAVVTSTQQGIFTSRYRYVPALHRWAFTSPVQRTTGRYDEPAGLFTDSKQHTYVGFWLDF